MGGINIYCGSFSGEDKSGTAFETVLDDVMKKSGPKVAAVVSRITLALEDASDHVLIQPDDAAALIDPLKAYNANFGGEAEEFDLKRYCSIDLLKACETAVAEAEPVALVW